MDLTTDSLNVYLLLQESTLVLRKAPIDGSGSWSDAIQVPAGTRTIAATKDAIFADTDRGPFTCKAPCNAPDWTALNTDFVRMSGGQMQLTGPLGGPLVGDPNKRILSATFKPSGSGIKLTSASSRYAYGVDADGKGYVYRNGDWRPLQGFKDFALASISGELDDTALYGIVQDGRVVRCSAPCQAASDAVVVNTQGNPPDATQLKQLSVNASSRQVWSLGPARGGDSGAAIFNKTDGDASDLAKQITPIDTQRDSAVYEIENRYKRAQVNKAAGDGLTQTTEYVAGLRPRLMPDEDPRVLRRQLDTMTMGVSMLMLQIALATVFVVLVVYVLLPSPWSHAIGFVLACVGTAVAFSVRKE